MYKIPKSLTCIATANRDEERAARKKRHRPAWTDQRVYNWRQTQQMHLQIVQHSRDREGEVFVIEGVRHTHTHTPSHEHINGHIRVRVRKRVYACMGMYP